MGTEIKKNGNMAVKSIKTFTKIKVKTRTNRLYNASSARKMVIMRISVQIKRKQNLKNH